MARPVAAAVVVGSAVLTVMYCEAPVGPPRWEDQSYMSKARAKFAHQSASMLLVAGQTADKSQLANAIRLLEESASYGFSPALVDLARCYEKGIGVEQDGDHALTLYGMAADMGNKDALFKIALCYAAGKGRPHDISRAVAMLRSAADAGSADAMFALGAYHIQGRGVARDAAAGVEWITKAADMGVTDACFALGAIYYEGKHGIPVDPKLAFKYYDKAAAKGNVRALYNVGYFHLHGVGVRKNETKAVEFFRKAMAQGDLSSMIALAECYMVGTGVQMDKTRAEKLLQEAALHGSKSAADILRAHGWRVPRGQ